MASQGVAWQGAVGSGKARYGLAGEVWCVLARSVAARSGEVWQARLD